MTENRMGFQSQSPLYATPLQLINRLGRTELKRELAPGALHLAPQGEALIQFRQYKVFMYHLLFPNNFNVIQFRDSDVLTRVIQ